MSIAIGTRLVKEAYVGKRKINQIYWGDRKVYHAAPPQAPKLPDVIGPSHDFPVLGANIGHQGDSTYYGYKFKVTEKLWDKLSLRPVGVQAMRSVTGERLVRIAVSRINAHGRDTRHDERYLTTSTAGEWGDTGALLGWGGIINPLVIGDADINSTEFIIASQMDDAVYDPDAPPPISGSGYHEEVQGDLIMHPALEFVEWGYMNHMGDWIADDTYKVAQVRILYDETDDTGIDPV